MKRFGLSLAEEAQVRTRNEYAMVLDIMTYLARCGSAGATSDEVEQALGFSHQSVSARLNNLAHAGCARQIQNRRKTSSGSTARPYVLVPNAKFGQYLAFKGFKKTSLDQEVLATATAFFRSWSKATTKQDQIKSLSKMTTSMVELASKQSATKKEA